MIYQVMYAHQSLGLECTHKHAKLHLTCRHLDDVHLLKHLVKLFHYWV